MSNTHAIADTAYELQATCEDLLPACVISTTFPTVPASSLTLSAFATQAYVRDGQALVYCDQPAITLTLSSAAGTNWLAITRDTSTAYATWTRRAGSHYMFQLAGARPPDVDGLLVFSSVTVSGGVITAVTPAPGVTLAEAWRARAGLGTMSVQNASAVAVTGGTATGLTILHAAECQIDGNTLMVDGPNSRVGIGTFSPAQLLDVAGNTLVQSRLYLGGVIGSPGRLEVKWTRASEHGIALFPSADTGANATLLFHNTGGTQIGSITQTATATAYNTSSDVRLKHAIAALTGALDAIAALRPVRFRWNADDSADEGFLAHELQQVLPRAVTGLPDAVNEDGSVQPQQVDHSKIVVFLVGAIQELLKRVEVLEELVTAP